MEELDPPMDPRTRAMMVESMVEDELYKSIEPGWDIIRERSRWTDLTVLQADGEPVFDVEVKLMRLRGRRVDQMQVDAMVGKLWMSHNQKRINTLRRNQSAIVVVLQNDENQFEASVDLFRALHDCVEAGLLAAYAVLGLEVNGYFVNFVPVQTAYTWPTRSENIRDMALRITNA